MKKYQLGPGLPGLLAAQAGVALPKQAKAVFAQKVRFARSLHLPAAGESAEDQLF